MHNDPIVTAPRSPRSAALLSMGTCGLSTKTLSPSRCLSSERSALPSRALVRQGGQLPFGVREQAVDRLLQLALRRVELRRLAFEPGVVMPQPRLVQPVDRRDPLDPSPGTSA